MSIACNDTIGCGLLPSLPFMKVSYPLNAANLCVHLSVYPAVHNAVGLEHDWVCRGEPGGDSDTRQRGAARPGLQNIPWRPTLLQVPSHPLFAAAHCPKLLA